MLTIRALAVLLLYSLAGQAGAAEPEPFEVFFSRFCVDATFRSERTAVPLEECPGNEADGGPVRESWSAERIGKGFIPPLSDRELDARGLAQGLNDCGSECQEVFQYREEADSYLLSYQFKRQSGFWYLVEYRDESR